MRKCNCGRFCFDSAVREGYALYRSGARSTICNDQSHSSPQATIYKLQRAGKGKISPPATFGRFGGRGTPSQASPFPLPASDFRLPIFECRIGEIGRVLRFEVPGTPLWIRTEHYAANLRRVGNSLNSPTLPLFGNRNSAPPKAAAKRIENQRPAASVLSCRAPPSLPHPGGG